MGRRDYKEVTSKNWTNDDGKDVDYFHRGRCSNDAKPQTHPQTVQNIMMDEIGGALVARTHFVKEMDVGNVIFRSLDGACGVQADCVGAGVPLTIPTKFRWWLQWTRRIPTKCGANED